MLAIILYKVVLLLLWNVIPSSQDFLEYYQPRPGFPKELNDWLSYVQGHRNDFRVIRTIVKQRQDGDYYEERMPDYKLSEFEDSNDLIDNEDDQVPENDIYPHVYKNENVVPGYNRRRFSNSARTRRESKINAFFERNYDVEVEPKGRIGEIKRSNNKYPDQFARQFKDDSKKREIQIDILNDGKLLRSIKEDNKNAKSIVLNIQKDSKSDINEETENTQNRPNMEINKDEPKNNEEQSNYQNLFTSNENLNTDSSIARDALAKTALMYHVTLPDPNFIVHAENVSKQHNNQQNNLNDMSKSWTASEKNQLIQGIQFAQDTGNIRRLQQNNPQKPVDKDGFESAKTVVVEHVPVKENSENLQPQRPQNKRNLETLEGKVKMLDLPSASSPCVTSNIREQFQTTMPNILPEQKDMQTVFNLPRIENEYPKHLQKPNNHVQEIKEYQPKVDENINNHIAITIVEPVKDEEPQEEIDNIVETNFDRTNKPIVEDKVPSTNSEKIITIMRGTPINNEVTENSLIVDENKENVEPKEGENIKNQFNLDSQVSDNKFPVLKHNTDYDTKECEGLNCRVPDKYNKNRGKRRHKHKHFHSSWPNANFTAFKFRQLKTVDYVYDRDLDGPDVDYGEESISSGQSEQHKKSVEGDYGDEEDSVASKEKSSFKLVKKTDNIFANPHTTEDPKSDEDYYNELESKQAVNENHKLQDDMANLSKRVHKKNKSVGKSNQGQDVAHYIREPRDTQMDSPQLPKFVIEDRENEENLRKRSLQKESIQNLKNKFPLSSKSFFEIDNPQRRELNDLDIVVDKSENSTEKRSSDADIMKSGELLGGPIPGNDNSFKEVTDISVVTTTNSVTDKCESTHISLGPVCVTENVTHIKIPMTTVLNLVAEQQSDLNNTLASSNEQYQNLEDILVGKLPISIVDSVFKHMKANPVYKQRFFRGMKRTNQQVSFKNLPEISQKESKKLINLMSNIMNRLQWTTTCQILPYKLKRYLKSITRVKVQDPLTKAKEMEEVEFADSQNQTSFIFHSSNGVNNIDEKVRILKNMLIKFQKLPDSCKPRAEPVKEYIENHLDMLTNVMSNNMEGSQPRKSEPKQEAKEQHQNFQSVRREAPVKRNEKSENSNDLIEQELESIGLGKNSNFKPKFDLDALLHKADQNKPKNGQEEQNMKKGKKRNIKRESGRETSEEYERLLEAVKRERNKREGAERIAETFGKLNAADYNGGENSDNAIQELFESPLVYSF